MEFFNNQSLFIILFLATINPIQAMEIEEYYGINEMAIIGQTNSHRQLVHSSQIRPISAVLPKCSNIRGNVSHSAH